MARRVVITGIGVVSAAGVGADAVWDALRAGRSGLRPMERPRTVRWGGMLAGEIVDDLRALGAPRGGSRSDKLAAVALGRAFDSARLERGALGAAGLVVGGTTGGVEATEDAVIAWRKRRELRLLRLAWRECASSADRCARIFGLGGPVATLSTACSSGALAIAAAAEMIVEGEADRMAAGGVDSLSRLTINGFNSLLLVDAAGCRPFDAARVGMSLGEGAAFVVLEEESAAAARGAAMLARLSGWGASCDAHHATAPHPEGLGALAAMLAAAGRAGLAPGEIGYVNAHGTGTPDNDVAEGAALRAFFGGQVPPFSSVKRFFGHTLAASGAIEAAVCVEALRRGELPPNLGFETVDPAIGIKPIIEMTPSEARHVISNSFGFGGNNAALVISRGTGVLARDSSALHSPETITADDEMIQWAMMNLHDERYDRLKKALVQMNFSTEDDILDAVAADMGMQRVDLSKIDFTAKLLDQISPAIAKKYQVVPVEFHDDELSIAVSDPNNIQAIDDLGRLLRKIIRPMIAREEEIYETIKRHYESEDASATPSPRVAVIGLGAISPAGSTLEELFAALRGGGAAPESIRIGPPLPEMDALAYRCNDIPAKEELDAGRRRRLNRLLQITVIAARRARRAAGLEGAPPEERAAICFGTGHGCMGDTLAFLENMADNDERAPMPAKFINSVHNAPAAQAALELGARGLNSAPTHREISFEIGLWQAMAEVASGRAPLAYAGAGDEIVEAGLAAERLWPARSRAMPSGEGAAVAALAPVGSASAPMAVVSLCAFGRAAMRDRRRVDAAREADWIESRLARAEIALNEIDAILAGLNGLARLDEDYRSIHAELERRAGRPIALARYKQATGEFPSASALGFVAAVGLVRGEIPLAAMAEASRDSSAQPRRVLLHTLSAHGSRAITVVSAA